MTRDVALAAMIRQIIKTVILQTDAKLYHGEQVPVDDMANDAAAQIVDLIDPSGGEDTLEILEEAEHMINRTRYVELDHAIQRILWEEVWATLELQGMQADAPPCETPSSYDFVTERAGRMFERIQEKRL